jgi:SAC3 family protein LENG8/THP3
MLHSNNKRDLLSSMARYYVINIRISDPNLFINWIVIDIFFCFSLSKEAKQDAAVKHALAVHASVLSGNYVLFFKLYKKAPNLNSCLMGKERYTSLK